MVIEYKLGWTFKFVPQKEIEMWRYEPEVLIAGTFLVLVSIIMTVMGVAWSWFYLVVGSSLLLVFYTAPTKTPEEYKGVPKCVKINSYSVYSGSRISSKGEFYVRLEDGGEVSDYYFEG